MVSLIKIKKRYNKNGFIIENCYNEKNFLKIKMFVCEKIYNILQVRNDLKKYHLLPKSIQSKHSINFSSKNRFFNPPASIKKIILNKKTKKLIKFIIGKNRLWKDKNGSISFRIVRPGLKDGYPYSRKEWGPAKKVLSIWMPIIGNSKNETLKILPKSHLKEYKKYLPKQNKFQKEEFRLAEKINEKKFKRFYIKYGSILFYHPKLIHSENVEQSKITRINLEFRMNPIKK